MEKIERIYRILIGEYGNPTWAPRADPMSELIGTILSQNTSDVNSHRAFQQLRALYPTWEAIHDAPTEEVAAAIKVGGLANIKALRIKRILHEISERFGGFDLDFLRQLPVGEAKATLRSLSGVGPKTAACVLIFSLGMPALPVDTHVYRVSRRLGLIDAKTSVEQAHEELEQQLPSKWVYPFHVGLITHGRRVCKAQRPRCPTCPLLVECDYGRSALALASQAQVKDAAR